MKLWLESRFASSSPCSRLISSSRKTVMQLGSRPTMGRRRESARRNVSRVSRNYRFAVSSMPKLYSGVRSTTSAWGWTPGSRRLRYLDRRFRDRGREMIVERIRPEDDGGSAKIARPATREPIRDAAARHGVSSTPCKAAGRLASMVRHESDALRRARRRRTGFAALGAAEPFCAFSGATGKRSVLRRPASQPL